MLAALVACHAAVAAASPSVQTKAGSIVLAVDDNNHVQIKKGTNSVVNIDDALDDLILITAQQTAATKSFQQQVAEDMATKASASALEEAEESIAALRIELDEISGGVMDSKISDAITAVKLAYEAAIENSAAAVQTRADGQFASLTAKVTELKAKDAQAEQKTQTHLKRTEALEKWKVDMDKWKIANTPLSGCKEANEKGYPTDGGGWTLILRDSWQDKSVQCGKDCAWLREANTEFSHGSAGSKADYIGPHLLGVVAGTNPLQTKADILYTIDKYDHKDAMFISHQTMSFHNRNQGQIEQGKWDKPLKTLGGREVWSGNPHHFWRTYPAHSCGLSTDRTTGDNCWNNMFASHRWENMPGGNSKPHENRCDAHAGCKKAGDANMLWARLR
eukprot:gene5923-18360_t